jgi:hypothetical protein
VQTCAFGLHGLAPEAPAVKNEEPANVAKETIVTKLAERRIVFSSSMLRMLRATHRSRHRAAQVRLVRVERRQRAERP